MEGPDSCVAAVDVHGAVDFQYCASVCVSLIIRRNPWGEGRGEALGRTLYVYIYLRIYWMSCVLWGQWGMGDLLELCE